MRSSSVIQSSILFISVLFIANTIFITTTKTKVKTIKQSIFNSLFPWFSSLTSAHNQTTSVRIHPFLNVQDKSTCKPQYNPLPTLKPFLPNGSHPSTLLEYIHFHRRYRSCLDGKNTTDRVETCTNVPPIFIWSCPPTPCCGLGDRLNYVLFAFIISIVSNRLFFIDWPLINSTHSYPLEIGLSPSRIDWRLPLDLRREKERTQFLNVSFIYWKKTNQTFTINSTTQFNFLTDDFPNILNDISIMKIYPRIPNMDFVKILENEFILKQYPELKSYSKHQSKAYFQFTRALFQTLFQPSRAVEHRILHLNINFPQSYHAIHLRTGLDIERTDPRFQWARIHSPNKLAKIMLDCLTHIENNSTLNNLYVATDSIDVKHEFQNIAKQKGIQIHSIMTPAIHLASRSENPHPCEQFLDVFVDLVMLSRSNAFLSTGSFLADAAFLLGNSVEKRFIIPKGTELKCSDIIRYSADYHDRLES